MRIFFLILGCLFPPDFGGPIEPLTDRAPKTGRVALPDTEEGIGRTRRKQYRDALDKRAQESKWEYVL